MGNVLHRRLLPTVDPSCAQIFVALGVYRSEADLNLISRRIPPMC
jgi:hypothetical protein